jgi:hypothetical protein
MRQLTLSLFFALGVAQSAAAQASPALILVGENGTPKAFSMAELSALPQVEIQEREADSSKVVFRGPALRALVTLVGAPTGRALRGPAMTLAVLAEATDGYKVGYMLSEIDEQFGARNVIVALTQNGQALAGTDGPLRIIVAGEEHKARWVRQLTRLRLVRIGP